MSRPQVATTSPSQSPLDDRVWWDRAKIQPTIRHHTKVLAEAGVIEGDKRGRWTYWRLLPSRLEALRSLLEA